LRDATYFSKKNDNDPYWIEYVHVREKDIKNDKDNFLKENAKYQDDMIKKAVFELKCNNNKNSAFSYIGKALHALQDRVFNQSGVDNNDNVNFSALNQNAVQLSVNYIDSFFELLYQEMGYNPLIE